MTLTDNAKRAIHAQETDEIFLPIAKLTHPVWPEPFLIVPNDEPVTHLGEIYEPFPFLVNPPNDEEGLIPVLNWVADNVSREMIVALRSVTGAVTVRIAWIMLSEPDDVQIGPYTMKLKAVEYDELTVQGNLGIRDIMNKSFGYLRMTPSLTPALF